MADWCEMGIVNVNVNVFGIKLGIGYRRFEGKRWLIAGLEGTPIKKKKKKVLKVPKLPWLCRS